MKWVAVFVAAVALQRFGELAISARHARRVRARGAHESGAGHFPLIVLVHVLFPLCLVAETALLGATPGRWWPAWLALWAGAQLLRYSAIHALGDRWNVRILVVPGEAPVQSGPYRFLRHPNYVAIVAELFAGPMVFGAWRTALLITVVNAFALRLRIRAENAALGGGAD